MARHTLGGIASGGPAGSIIRGMGADQATPKGLPVLDGNFAIVTDGEIVANNTDDGSRAAAAGLRRLA